MNLTNAIRKQRAKERCVCLEVAECNWLVDNVQQSRARRRLGFKSCLSKTNTMTKTHQFQDQDQDFDVQDQDRYQDLQDQYWKSMTGMDCDKQKDRKSHGKQKIQHTGSCTQ